MSEITLQLSGPFSYLPGVGLPIIYDALEASGPGVYLWTVPFEGRKMINYVGISAKSIADRHDYHMRLYLSGKYSIYDPVKFARLEKVKLFTPGVGKLPNFLSQYETLSQALVGHLRCIQIFVAPVAVEKVLLERIESSIIEALRTAGGRPGAFLDNDRVSRFFDRDQRMPVFISNGDKFEGMRCDLLV